MVIYKGLKNLGVTKVGDQYQRDDGVCFNTMEDYLDCEKQYMENYIEYGKL